MGVVWALEGMGVVWAPDEMGVVRGMGNYNACCYIHKHTKLFNHMVCYGWGWEVGGWGGVRCGGWD